MDVSSYVPERMSAPVRHFLTGCGLGNDIFRVCIQLYFGSLGFDGASACLLLRNEKGNGVIADGIPAQ